MEKMKIGVGLIIFLMVWTVFQTAYAEPREIRIGATVSATGKFATEVGPFKKLLEAWAGKINEQGAFI